MKMPREEATISHILHGRKQNDGSCNSQMYIMVKILIMTISMETLSGQPDDSIGEKPMITFCCCLSIATWKTERTMIVAKLNARTRARKIAASMTKTRFKLWWSALVVLVVVRVRSGFPWWPHYGCEEGELRYISRGGCAYTGSMCFL